MGEGQTEHKRVRFMKIKILDSASPNLIEGYWFYEKQQGGLGSYFLDTLFSDSELTD